MSQSYKTLRRQKAELKAQIDHLQQQLAAKAAEIAQLELEIATVSNVKEDFRAMVAKARQELSAERGKTIERRVLDAAANNLPYGTLRIEFQDLIATILDELTLGVERRRLIGIDQVTVTTNTVALNGHRGVRVDIDTPEVSTMVLFETIDKRTALRAGLGKESKLPGFVTVDFDDFMRFMRRQNTNNKA